VFAYIAGLPNNWGLYLMMAALPIGWVLCTFVHELGHAVGAMAVGWRVVIFAVGRTALQIPNRSVGLLKQDNPHRELAGWVLAIPPTRSQATLKRDIVFTAAGPVASLVFAILLLAGALSIPHQGGSPRFEPALIVGGLAWQSFALFLINAIPHQGANRSNDGMSIVSRIRQGASNTVTLSPLVWMFALHDAGTRLRDYPQWLVSDCDAVTRGDAELERWLEVLLIGRALDAASPDAKAARAMIDSYHERYPASHWSVACEAYLASVLEERTEAAEAVMEKVTDPSDIPQLTLAAQAAIAMRRGRTGDAKLALDEMDVIVRSESVFTDMTYRDIRRIIEGLPPSGVRPLIADVKALS
jgi:hypothetical protein